VNKLSIVIGEQGGEWIVALSVNGGVPFVESFFTKADAWRGAKAHGDHAGLADEIDVRYGEREAKGLTADGLTAWLRAAWKT